MSDYMSFLNRELASKVLAWVINHPERHNQLIWFSTDFMYNITGMHNRNKPVTTECGTIACLAGWTIVFAGVPRREITTTLNVAREKLLIAPDRELTEKETSVYVGMREELARIFLCQYKDEALEKFAALFELERTTGELLPL